MIEAHILSLHQKLQSFFNTYPLRVAGRFTYFDPEISMFVLAIHSTSPEETQELGQKAWEDMPVEIKEELEASQVGFAIRQI